VILTPFTSQAELIEEVLKQKAFNSGLSCVCPVFHFQSCPRPFDIVLISLSQSDSTGLLGVSPVWLGMFSRALRGLYVFGHGKLIRDTQEGSRILTPLLKSENNALTLIRDEKYGCQRKLRDKVSFSDLVEISDVMEMNQLVSEIQRTGV
jgi:hypothetical protein